MSDTLAPRFDGQCVVVTGVGRAGQVGESVALEFGRRGAAVEVIDMSGALAEERATALRGEGFTAVASGGDLTDAVATVELFRQIAARNGGKIHALANIAGGFASSGPVGESDPAVFQRQLAINLGSAYGATRAAMPYLRAAHGAVLFMASAAVLPGGSVAGIAGYAAAKAGVLALMHAVAQEEAANGVRANALAPTSIRTAANSSAMGDGVKYVEREAVAAMIALLCSPAAANITGQVIALA
jgi:3-oxoacyl-[acyl-carrier protein] reductase